MQTIRYLLAQHSQLAMFIAFFTFGMALYAPHIGNPFVLDDMTKIQWNPDLKESLPTLSTFLSPYHEIETPFRNDPSRPITFLAYWLCWQIGNGQSWPFHLLSIVIHILCAGLLSALVMRSSSPEAELGVRRAAAHAVGLLFLASPLLAGSVYYAFALSDLLAACFLLLALNNHMSNKKNHALEALLFGLALFSKQSSIVLPALYLILDWSQERLRKANYVLPVTMGVLYLIFRIWFFGAIGDLEAHGEVQARLPYLLSEGVMIWKYIGLFLMPQGLTIDHFITVGTHSWNLQISAWISLILIIGCCVFNKKLFQYTWGLLFFIVCLLPTSSAFPTVDLFVERRAYFATVGLYFLLATLFILAMKRAQFARRKLVWTLLLVTKIAINSSFTFARGQVYSSTESLWRESYLLYPKNPRARLNLATALSVPEHYEEAQQLLEGLLKDQPDSGVIYAKLAFIFAQIDNPNRSLDRSWAFYRKALEYDPNNLVTLLNAGSLLLNQSKSLDAAPLVERALNLNSNMPYAHYLAGVLALQKNQRAQALEHFHMALKLDPQFKEVQAFVNQLEGHL